MAIFPIVFMAMKIVKMVKKWEKSPSCNAETVFFWGPKTVPHTNIGIFDAENDRFFGAKFSQLRVVHFWRLEIKK